MTRRGSRRRVRSPLASDVDHSIRALLRSPLTTIPAVLTLALAIGANIAVFSVINALLLRHLPVHEPDRLMSISSDFAAGRGFRSGAGWNHAMWTALQGRSSLFEGVLAWMAQSVTLGDSNERLSASAYFVSGGFFSTLGVQPLHGRLLTDTDDRSGADPVAVISHSLWLRRFAGSLSVIGSTMVVDSARVRVVGVAPKSFTGLEMGRPLDIALPLHAEPAVRGGRSVAFTPRSYLLLVMLRLKPGQTIPSATNTLRSIQADVVPAAAPAFVREPFTLVPASTGVVGPTSAQLIYRRPLLLMLAGVGIVLFVACFNIANLLLTRATTRRRELAVRAALGASRWQLGRPLLVESALLAVAGCALGFAVAPWCARAILLLSPLVLDPPLDARVAAFTAGITGLALVLFGVAPAYRAGHVKSDVLLRNGRGSDVPGRRRVAGTLVVLQLAFSLVLLTAAGLLVRTLSGLANVPLGFDADRVLIASIGIPRSIEAQRQPVAVRERLLRRLEELPGIESAAASLWTPLSGAGAVTEVRLSNDPSAAKIAVLTNYTGPGWFGVYGTPILSGRDFGEQDSSSSQQVAIVNEAFARTFIPAKDVIGTTMTDGRVVVGLARDAVYRSSQRIPGIASVALREPVPPTIYVPLAQLSRRDAPPSDTIRVSIRSAGTRPDRLAASVVSAIAAIDPSLVFQVRPLEEDVRASLAPERFSAVLAAAFALLALTLSVIGLNGITAHDVSTRVHEIGVRLALGALPRDVFSLVLSSAALGIGAGIAIGLCGSVFVGRLLASTLYGIEPLDPITFGATSVLFASVGLVAAFVPAWRAAHVDPAMALRAE